MRRRMRVSRWKVHSGGAVSCTCVEVDVVGNEGGEWTLGYFSWMFDDDVKVLMTKASDL